LIARALLRQDRSASVTLVTGLANSMPWLDGLGCVVARLPTIKKGSDGQYYAPSGDLGDALRERERALVTVIDRTEPDVVLVDRYPYGSHGEFRRGVERARLRGARLAVGLRDVLNEPAIIRSEMSGPGWEGVEDLYEVAFVYGAPDFADHEAEYGLPLRPVYCGWVADEGICNTRHPRRLVVTAGGGFDGLNVFKVAVHLLTCSPEWNGLFIAGPFADADAIRDSFGAIADRVTLLQNPADSASLVASGRATVQMGGYNSVYETMAARVRPIVVPRQWPGREQVIRAQRLAVRGLADVVDPGRPLGDTPHLLDRNRWLAADDLERAGIDLNGVTRVAGLLQEMALSISLELGCGTMPATVAPAQAVRQ
jgi:predicted glycosyltransferase